MKANIYRSSLRRLAALAVTVLLLVLAGGGGGGAAGDAGRPISVLTADARGVTLEVTTPALQAIETAGGDGRTYLRLALDGFTAGAVPGRPELPARSVLLAVPPGATLHLSIEPLRERASALAWPVYPAPAQALDWGPHAGASDDPWQATGLRDVFTLDAAAYAAPALSGAVLATLEDAGYLRDVRLARLTVYPLQYDPTTGNLRHVEQMRLVVSFAGAQMPPAAAPQADPGRFDALLADIVINPDQLALFRTDPPAPALRPAALPLDQTRTRITLRDTGLYRLTYTDLLAAGVPLDSADPRNFQMYLGDAELAIEVTGAADGRFDAGDLVRFYARAVDSPYTDTATVWLVVGSAPGKRMAARDVAPGAGALAPGFPDTQHFEQERVYRSTMPMSDSEDHWYWGQTFVLSRSSSPTLTVPFTIEHPLAAGLGTLKVELWGASSDVRARPDHHSRLLINGVAVGDMSWSGAVQAVGSITFTQDMLRPGGNVLTIFTPGDTGSRDVNGQPWEVTWLNWFDLTYQRAFTVTGERLAFTPVQPGAADFALAGWAAPDPLLVDTRDPLAPVRLNGALSSAGAAQAGFTVRLRDNVGAPGAAYLAVGEGAVLAPRSVLSDAPSGLRNPAEGADYLVIAHADFVAGSERLAAYRRSQGLRVRVVDVQDVYDEFNGGQLSPQAIRDFIQYAYFNWPRPAPAFVLLVGDGTYDFLNREGYGARTFVPPYLASADPVIGETAADNRFVTVSGDDLMPDLHLGRLPVNSLTELDAMLDKILAYEQAPAAGDWRTRATFVTDNADYAGDFSALANAATAHLPPDFSVRKVYLGSTQYPLTSIVQAQQATLAAFNEGALLFNYVGHSSIGNWAAEFLFGVNALSQVNNGPRYPVLLPMTCLEGSYQSPRFPSLSENVVRLSGRGAVASWAPTGLGVASGHDYLHRAFFDAVFQQGLVQLGPATTAGKLNLFVNARFADGRPRFHDLLDTYVLLGDPASELALPKAQLTLAGAGAAGQLIQGDPITYTLSYSNAGALLVRSVVLTAEVPAGLVDLAWQAAGAALTPLAGAPFRWLAAELAPGAGGQVTITGRIPLTITTATLPFRAEIGLGAYPREQRYDDNRVGPLIVTLPAADLWAKQVAAPTQPVLPGQRVTFTLAFVNRGPGMATGISVTLPLPVALADAEILSSGPPLTPRADAPYAWDVGPLRSGEAGSISIRGRIPDDIHSADALWRVTGRVGASWPDPDPANNMAETVIVTVLILDRFEPDDSMGTAQRIVLPLAPQAHTFHQPSDQDWSVFHAHAGVAYTVRATGLSGNDAMVLSLWSGDGYILAKNDTDGPLEGLAAFIWTAPADGDYFIMAAGYTSPVGASYEVSVQPQYRHFMPFVP